jgi:hypothetical protein
MPKGRALSEFEKGRIAEMAREKRCYRFIAREVGRSFSVVRNYLTNPEGYGRNHGGGRQRALTDADVRHLQRLASNNATSVSRLRSEINTTASRSTVYNALRAAPHLVHRKMQSKPKVTAEHQTLRLDFALECIVRRLDWRSVVVSDEKKFNLDGPDGFAHYWHDLRKEPLFRMSRVHGGGSVMVWACSGYNGVRFVFVSGKMNAVEYKRMLKQQLLPFGAELGGPDWSFQQDNAPIHTAGCVARCLDKRNVNFIRNWPSRSPDLNLQENVWGIIARDVYAGGRQYNSVQELKAAIEQAFNRVDMMQIQHLFETMPNRIFDVIYSHGKPINY